MVQHYYYYISLGKGKGSNVTWVAIESPQHGFAGKHFPEEPTTMFSLLRVLPIIQF